MDKFKKAVIEMAESCEDVFGTGAALSCSVCGLFSTVFFLSKLIRKLLTKKE